MTTGTDPQPPTGRRVRGARGDAAIRHELARIEDGLTATRQLLEFMLAFRILEADHAKNLGAAMKIARDLDQVRALFPEDDGD